MTTHNNQLKINTMPVFIVLSIFLSCFNGIQAQITYPHNFTYNGNPLSRFHGASDPEAHVWNDTVWVICSQDNEGGYETMDGYHVFSSADLINWTDHGDVFNSTMLNDSLWGPTPDHWMWAPGAARKKDENGKWIYYLYYPHNNKFNGENWVTGVATAPSPAGPYTDHGPLKGGEMAMDPMVFVDDDGEAYIYSNSYIVAKLKPDMMTLAEAPRKINYAPDSIHNDKTLHFGEGSYMHKRKGIYYYSYSNFNNNKYQAFYATGNNPYGPFTWQGPMAPAPVSGQDHHSLINFKDQWYYFYHIALPDIPKNKIGQGRIACFDRLYYNNDGTIQTVVHTQGPTKWLKISSQNGIVELDPPGGSYTPGTSVKVKAIGDLGYAFKNWDGDFSGQENPLTIIINDDKHISANFKEVPIYKIDINAINGSVMLNPTGGKYSEGVKVTLTPVDQFGYDFASWSGSISGSQKPYVLLMDNDKNVTATFKKVPTYTISTDSKNGSIELNPPGGNYEKDTKITISSKPNFGFQLSKWGGDLSGNKQKEEVIIKRNLNISAEYTFLPAENNPWKEDFTFPNGTTSDNETSSWRTMRAKGKYQVIDNCLVINEGDAEGIFVSGVIDIAQGPVDISLDVWTKGGVDAGDFVSLYKIVDGGPETFIGKVNNKLKEPVSIKGDAVGKNLVLVIRAKVSAGDEFYLMDNLNVSYKQ